MTRYTTVMARIRALPPTVDQSVVAFLKAQDPAIQAGLESSAMMLGITMSTLLNLDQAVVKCKAGGRHDGINDEPMIPDKETRTYWVIYQICPTCGTFRYRPMSKIDAKLGKILKYTHLSSYDLDGLGREATPSLLQSLATFRRHEATVARYEQMAAQNTMVSV